MYFGYLCLLSIMLCLVLCTSYPFSSGSPVTKKITLILSGVLRQFERSQMQRSYRTGRCVQSEEFFFLRADFEANLRKIVIKLSNYSLFIRTDCLFVVQEMMLVSGISYANVSLKCKRYRILIDQYLLVEV